MKEIDTRVEDHLVFIGGCLFIFIIYCNYDIDVSFARKEILRLPDTRVGEVV